MTFPNSDYKNRIRPNQIYIPVTKENKVFALSSSTPIKENQELSIGVISPFERCKQRLESVGLVDDRGWVTKEAIGKYPLESFDLEEHKTWINLNCKPITTKFGITFSILEFRAFQLVVGPKVGIKICSTNWVGGCNPFKFPSYYIRTWNEIYKKRCKELNLVPEGDLICKEIEEDLHRRSPDYDLATGIEGDLSVANDLTTKFFAWKLANVNKYDKYDLATALKDVFELQNKLVIQNGVTQFTIDSIPVDCEKRIRDSFFHNFYDNSSITYYDDSECCFAMAAFGKNHFFFDHNYLHQEKIGRTIFQHHGLIVPDEEPVIKLIELLVFKAIQLQAILDNMDQLPKITPKGGLQATAERIWKTLRTISNVNKGGWGAFVSNRAVGYDVWDPHMGEELFRKVHKSEVLDVIKSKWEGHHFKNPFSLVLLGLNAMIFLPEDAEYENICRTLWKEIMNLYDSRILDLAENKRRFFDENKLPFFMALKSVLSTEAIPFSMVRDILQIYGCLCLSSPQSEQPSALKVRLSNSEALWHEVNISQKVNKIVYAMPIPLNLNEAIDLILQLNDSQLDLLDDLLKNLLPKEAYKKDLIPKGLFDEKLANQALKCFDHSHPVLKRLGYELLLLHSFRDPELWVLKNLIKYLHIIVDDAMAMSNLENVLAGYPDNLENHKLLALLKAFCQSNKANSNSGRVEFCMAMADTDLSSTSVNLYSRLTLSPNEKLKFLKNILSKDPLESAKLFANLQGGNSLSDKEEIDLFQKIHEAVKKNSREVSYASQLLAITTCANLLFRKQRMESIVKPAFVPVINIINALIASGFIYEALDLLNACSRQQFTLVNANQDTEVWLNVCEAGLKRPNMDIEYLQDKWNKRFTFKFSDQKLALRKTSLEYEFKKRLYEKYWQTFNALRNSLNESCRPEDIEKINQQIKGQSTDILNLVSSPELIECGFEFLKQMAVSEKAPQQAYIDLAINMTLECAKSCLTDIEKLKRLDDIVKTYLDAEKEPGKEFKIRQASLKIAEAFLLKLLPQDAVKWMRRIFRIVSPNTNGVESVAEDFGTEKTSLSLLSLNLPPKPDKFIEIIIGLPKHELDIFNKLIGQLPHSPSVEIAIRLKSGERSILVNLAKECLKHDHPIVKRMGFELMLCCAAVINDSNKIEIDASLIHELIKHLPCILLISEPNVRNKYMDRMERLLQASIYADYAAGYCKTISGAKVQKKPLYQANCMALALTKQENLCNIGKNLISKGDFDKFAPEFTLQDRIEIALSFIESLLPENVLLAYECTAKIENDVNQSKCASKAKALFISLIDALIKNNEFVKAEEQLINCSKKELLPKQGPQTTELWLKLLQKVLEDKLQGPHAAAKIWVDILKRGGLPKNHCAEVQISLLGTLISTLFDLKNELSDGFANKLIAHLFSFKLSETQKKVLLEAIENNIKFKLSNGDLVSGYQELANKSGSYLSEESKLSYRRSFLDLSIKNENYALAIEILTVIQKNDDAEFVITVFEALANKLITVNSENIGDEARFNQGYQLLKVVDSECLREVKLKTALQWLGAADKSSGNAYLDERVYLLKMILQMINHGFPAEDSAVEISGHLLKTLKLIEVKTQPIHDDLKSLIASCHPKIAQKLQSTAYLEIFCQYLTALHHHQILGKHNTIILPQALWMASEYLKNEVYDPDRLQAIHKLLCVFLQNSSSIAIDSDILINFVAALLAHKLPREAEKWIEYAIAPFSKMDPGLIPTNWCEMLLELNEPQLCLKLLKALKGAKIQTLIPAELILKVSKLFLDTDTGASAQLLIDNWGYMQTNCHPKEDLEKHLETVIRKIFSSRQEIDVVALLPPLMALYKTQELSFLREQLRNCCVYMGKQSKDQADRSFKMIAKVFFERETDRSESYDKWVTYHLIKTLIGYQNRELSFLGVKELNVKIKQLLSNTHFEQPKFWISLCQEAIKSGLLVAGDSSMTSLELSEITLLTDHYSILICLTPFADGPKYEKDLTLLILQISLYQMPDDVEYAFEHYFIMLNKYHGDLEWLEKSKLLAIDSLIKMSISSNDYASFYYFYKKIQIAFNNINLIEYNRFLKSFIEKCLNSTLPESLIRSALLFQTGVALGSLFNYYNRNMIFDNAYSSEKEVVEIISLIDKYLFCLPVIEYEYIITMDRETNEIQEVANNFNSSPPVENLCKKRRLKAKEIEMFSSDYPTFEEDGITKFEKIVYPLTKRFFSEYFLTLVGCLEGARYYKGFPKSAMIFQLTTLERLQAIETEVPSLPKSTKREPGFYTFQEGMDGVSLVINRLIALKNHHSTEKAIRIIQNIPECLWGFNLEEFTHLFMQVMNNKNLLLQSKTIGEALKSLLASNKNIPEWIDISSKLCFYFFDRMNGLLNSNDRGISHQILAEAFSSAFLAFPYALDEGCIKNDHPEFVHYFKAQLKWIAGKNSIHIDGTQIAWFLESSLERNPKYKTEIFELINQNFDQLLKLEPIFFEHNINITVLLTSKGFFKVCPSHQENLSRKLLQNFENRLINDPPQTQIPHYYSDHLGVLFSLVLGVPNQKLQLQFRFKLHKIIGDHLSKFLPSSDQPEIVQKNIEMLLMLMHVKYFDETERSVKQLESFKEIIKKQVKMFCIQKIMTGELSFAMGKLFSVEELGAIFSSVFGDAFTDSLALSVDASSAFGLGLL